MHTSCSNSGKFFFPYDCKLTTGLLIVVRRAKKVTSKVQSKAKNRHSTASAASSSKCKVNDIREDEDENNNEIGSSASHKKAKTTDHDALSRLDVAEFIGELLMEIEGMNNTFNRI